MRFLIFVFLAMHLAAEGSGAARHALCYRGGERFGDRITVYVQARYLSYLTGVPFVFRTFPFSDSMTVSSKSQPYYSTISKYEERYEINSAQGLKEFFRRIEDPDSPPTFFILRFIDPDGYFNKEFVFTIPWNDRKFVDWLRPMLQPKVEIPQLTKPGILNVADHVRTLSGFDKIETSIHLLPLRHVNLEYHWSQIRKIYEWNKRRPMHVFLFSDTKRPRRLLEEFREQFNGCDIVFDIQESEEPDKHRVVQDFFAMQQFDVLINTQSNFSKMAANLGDFDLVISPARIQGKYPDSYIDQVKIVSKKSDWFPYEMTLILQEEDLSGKPIHWFSDVE